jgi:hypothetical protein
MVELINQILAALPGARHLFPGDEIAVTKWLV